MEQISLSAYPLAKIFKIAKTDISAIDFALCNQPKETLDHYYNRQAVKPDLMCNGGFFDMPTGGTIFTFVDEKQVISKDNNLLYGMGMKNGELTYGKYDSSYTDFVNGYPVLIEDSQPVSTAVGKEIDYNARRTILAYDNMYIYVIAVEAPGYTFSKIKNLLLTLKVTYAINLDGGGSTRILKNGKCMTDATIYNRPIDNLVCFYLKKEAPAPTIYYRVQTGAFSRKANADNFQQTIRQLDDKIGAGYKNAYVRLIDGLYKVQVGAFSKKENAVKVMNDLKAKGINSFITTT